MDKYKKKIDELKIEYDKQHRIVSAKKDILDKIQKEYDEANKKKIILNNQNAYYDDIYKKVTTQEGLLYLADAITIGIAIYRSINGFPIMLSIPITAGAVITAKVIQKYYHKDDEKLIKSISKRENYAKISELNNLLTKELIDKRFDAICEHSEEAIKLGYIRREVEKLTEMRNQFIVDLCKEQLEQFIDEKENYDVQITPMTNGVMKTKTLKQK